MVTPWASRVGAAATALLVAVVLSVARAMASDEQPASPASNGCASCHVRLSDVASARPVAQFREDVHRERGFGCVDCHGGDPASDDKARAKDRSGGYRGRPTGSAVIATCARCHSDAAFMRRYAPRQRVDQATEYATSVHGQRLAAGDLRVATCVSCHGAHGIRHVSDAKSPVFPLNVAATCATCHGNQAHMQGYTLPGGSPIPTNQRVEYERSVHYTALTKRNDLSAPTCNDCHGNHGAAPPGAGTVANVCGTCHAVFATRFETSVHRQIFDRGCAECHGNHAVQAGSDEMLGAAAPASCAACHTEGDNGLAAATAMRGGIERLKRAIGQGDALVARVKNAGMEVGDQELALLEARSRLTLARTEIHASNPSTVDPIVRDGLQILDGVERAGQAALEELRFRRRGLAASLVAILIVVVALGLKIREIDRRHDVDPAARPR